MFSRGQREQMMIQMKKMLATLNNLNTERSKMISYLLWKIGLKKDVQLNYIYTHNKTRW